ncbi:trace amine-associated receptor 13c-like [Menidia menidia]
MQLHTPTNVLLLSLAVSDFFVGLLVMPGEIFRKSSCWGNAMCVFYAFLIAHIVSASVGNIVLISLDRYVAICHPFHYPTKITMLRVKCCVCLCWLCAAFYRIIYFKDELVHPDTSDSCTGVCTFVVDRLEGSVDLVLNFIASVTAIVVLYVRVFVVAASHARAIRSHLTDASGQLPAHRTKRSELKAARTLGVLVFVYLICFSPYYCYSRVHTDVTTTSYASFLFFLFYFNSCLNPIMYAFFYPWFRKAVKLIVTLQIAQPGSCETNIL